MIKIKATLAPPLGVAETASEGGTESPPIQAQDSVTGFEPDEAADLPLAAASPARPEASAEESQSSDAAALALAAQAALNDGDAVEAVHHAERAVRLAGDSGASWFLLGVGRNNLGQRDAAIAALDEACALEPENVSFQAMKASIEARQEQGWQAGFRRLMGLHAQNPGDDDIAELVVRVCLAHATRDWTEVEEAEDGEAVVRTARKVLLIAAGSDIPPGLYPTRAEHVKTAALCLQQARAAGSEEPELVAGVEALSAELDLQQKRRFNATWGEIAISVISVGVGLLGLFSGAGAMALYMLLVGAAMITGSFEPPYRLNRIALSRRGATIGDAAIGLALQHRFGGLIYLGILIVFFPLVAAYKLYVNWGEALFARSELQDLLEETRARAAPPAPEGEASPVAEVAEPEPTATVRRPAPPAEVEPIRQEAPAPPRAESSVPQVASASAPQREERDSEAVEGEPPEVPLVVRPRLRAERSAPSRAMAIAAAVVVVVLGGGIAAWLLLRPQAPEPPGSAATNIRPQAPATAAAEGAAATAALPSAIHGRPRVLDTAALEVEGVIVRLHGVIGQAGVPARQMASFIDEQGGAVSCEPLRSRLYRCQTPNGYDIAAAALVNGGARAADDASTEYREMQATAQAERRGIWQ